MLDRRLGESRSDTRGPKPAALFISIRQCLWVEADPSDGDYQARYAAEMTGGFRILALLVFASMSVLYIVHRVHPYGLGAGQYDGPSAACCALLAVTGALALLVSRMVRSAGSAFLATATLLALAVMVMSVDRLKQVAPDGRAANTLLPILLSTLVLTAALLPLRPARMLGLGVLLFGSSCFAALLIGMPFRVDLVEVVGAVIVVVVSVAAAFRSTSQRIGLHHAHSSAIEAERRAETARERILLAESAITMERLAASLSHELNTPIGVLKSATQTLLHGFQRDNGFACGEGGGESIVNDLLGVIGDSTARLAETVARIQRFANLDRSAVRHVDVNQLVQDAVALMNPPSASQTRIKLLLEPLPLIWCRPHALNVAVASVLNKLLESPLPLSIETYQSEGDTIVRMAQLSTEAEFVADPDLSFAVVEGRVRASGWDLFAARQLVRESGGDLRVEGCEKGEQSIVISIPADEQVAWRAGASSVLPCNPELFHAGLQGGAPQPQPHGSALGASNHSPREA